MSASILDRAVRLHQAGRSVISVFVDEKGPAYRTELVEGLKSPLCSNASLAQVLMEDGCPKIKPDQLRKWWSRQPENKTT